MIIRGTLDDNVVKLPIKKKEQKWLLIQHKKRSRSIWEKLTLMLK